MVKPYLVSKSVTGHLCNKELIEKHKEDMLHLEEEFNEERTHLKERLHEVTEYTFIINSKVQ